MAVAPAVAERPDSGSSNARLRSLLRHRPCGPVCLLLLILLLPLAVSQAAETGTETAYAPSAETVKARRQTVEEETAALARAKVQLDGLIADRKQQLQQLSQASISQSQVEEARLAVDAAKLKLESIDLDRSAVERTQAEISQRIRNNKEDLKTLQPAAKNPEAEKARQEKIAQIEARQVLEQSLSEVETQHLSNLAVEQVMAQEHLRLAQEWWNALQEKQQQATAQVRKEALEEQEQRIRREQQALSERAAKLRGSLLALSGEGDKVDAERRLLETQIKETEEQTFLLQLRLKAARVVHQSEQSDQAVKDTALQPQELSKITDSLKQVLQELQAAQRLAMSKRDVLVQQLEVISKRRLGSAEERRYNNSERHVVEGLIADFNKQLEKVKAVALQGRAAVDRLDAAHQASASRSLTARHRLPEDAATWSAISQQLLGLPKQIGQAYAELPGILWGGLRQSGAGQWLVLLFSQLLWLGGWLWLGLSRRVKLWLDGIQHSLEQDPFSSRSFLIGIRMLRCNKTPIWLGVALLLYQSVLDIPPPSALLVNGLVVIWLGARLLIGLGYWQLASDLVEEQQRQPVLYRWLFWSVLTGAVLSVVMLFSYLGFLDTPAQELLGRFFLLFLFLPAYLLLRMQRLLISQLRERGRTTYWIGMVQVISLAVPLSMFASSVLGLIGYVNLAWSLARHLTIFLLVLFGWLIIRGLLRDLVNAGKNYTVVHFERGLVITQAVINPFYLLARLGLLITALWLLFRLYGWGADSAVVVAVNALLDQPLFTFGEVTVDLEQALAAIALVVLVVLLGRWVRQVTYRWFYTGIEDLGLRNSLAVFTQYSIVLLGLLIALNTLGLDLTSLAIFTGALGIGIGFGLQNIANNFISGIILLMERPLRAADWVTIGSYEGEVARIGIRSVTVTTWDNQDVIIPNADIISSPFINWTRTDEIVRTVLVIGISYHNDPHQAVEVISTAVHSVPEVLHEPEARIWLQEFADSSVNIRVHYFMNVKKASRLEVKSRVMFAIWDALKQNGINIPFPQQDVYIKELPKAMQGPGFKDSGEEPA